jgi:hypothetical protein
VCVSVFVDARVCGSVYVLHIFVRVHVCTLLLCVCSGPCRHMDTRMHTYCFLHERIFRDRVGHRLIIYETFHADFEPTLKDIFTHTSTQGYRIGGTSV